jgi:hypothetical protein
MSGKKLLCFLQENWETFVLFKVQIQLNLQKNWKKIPTILYFIYILKILVVLLFQN